MKLTVYDHDRGAAGKTYVYPVVSRRAGGVSVGINLNPNNACNFRCVYCQVPGLTPGTAPRLDVPLLRDELASLLDDICSGDFMTRQVPEGSRVLRDVALSGNGEPTSSLQLGEVIAVIEEGLRERQLLGVIPVVLITNGSLMLKRHVADAVSALSALNGEVWFKMDSVTEEGIARINGSAIAPDGQLERLERAASLCRTHIQTCLFAWDDQPPSAVERDAYLERIRELVRRETPIESVLLYGLARPSHQPEADRLSALPVGWLEAFADRIRAEGMSVRVSA